MDITMCNGNDCNRKEGCHRYTAIPNEYWQSYFYPDMRGESCVYFLSNEGWPVYSGEEKQKVQNV